MKKIAATALAITGFCAPAHALDIYAGVDMLMLEAAHVRGYQVPDSRPDAPPGEVRTDSEGDGIKIHAGLWLNESFAVELQVGSGADDAALESGDTPNTLELDSYTGLFIVPRAEPWGWVDVVFPVGWAKSTVIAPAAGADGSANAQLDTIDISSLAYGLDVKFKIGSLFADPDSIIGTITISAGFMMYGDDNDLNLRGYNGGLQVGMNF